MIVLGYDPGGKRANGLAWLDERHAETATVECADDGLAWFKQRLGAGQPHALGVDTLLSWSTKGSGWRPADLWLRERYNVVRNSIMSPNTLRGAMIINGIGLAIRARLVWPSVILNETHPKVLYFALTDLRCDYGPEMTAWFHERFALPCEPATEHEWDALLSAAITRDSLSGRIITEDLMNLEGTMPLLRPAGTVAYYWPRVSS